MLNYDLSSRMTLVEASVQERIADRVSDWKHAGVCRGPGREAFMTKR